MISLSCYRNHFESLCVYDNPQQQQLHYECSGHLSVAQVSNSQQPIQLSRYELRAFELCFCIFWMLWCSGGTRVMAANDCMVRTFDTERYTACSLSSPSRGPSTWVPCQKNWGAISAVHQKNWRCWHWRNVEHVGEPCPDGSLLGVLGDSSLGLPARGLQVGQGRRSPLWGATWTTRSRLRGTPGGHVLATGNQDARCRLWPHVGERKLGLRTSPMT
jgi:hypothetical protein